VLRKGYGLGAQAMAGGGFHAQNFTISWPTGEFGGTIAVSSLNKYSANALVSSVLPTPVKRLS
jgi:acetyl-CoA carboxylase carboxyltransferase component